MSKEPKKQPAPAGTQDNAAVRVWPGAVNAVGVITPDREVLKLTGKGKNALTIRAALVRTGDRLGVAVGCDYRTDGGVAAGGFAPSVSRAHATLVDAIESLEAYFEKTGLVCATDDYAVHIAAELTQAGEIAAICAALEVSEADYLAFIHDGKQPASAHAAAPKRILGKGKHTLRYNYTEAEINGFAKQLAGTHKAVADIEARKSRANQQFKMELEAQHDLVEDYSGRIREGYEMREYACTTYADTPEKGKKSVVRDDTGEVVAVYAMTYADLQEELPLDDKRKPAAAAAEESDDAADDDGDDA